MYHIGAGAASPDRGLRHDSTDIATTNTNCRAENMTARGKLRTFSLSTLCSGARVPSTHPPFPPVAAVVSTGFT